MIFHVQGEGEGGCSRIQWTFLEKSVALFPGVCYLVGKGARPGPEVAAQAARQIRA